MNNSNIKHLHFNLTGFAKNNLEPIATKILEF